MLNKPYDAIKLEKHLVNEKEWNTLEKLATMPPNIRHVANKIINDPFSLGGPVGIGYTEETGWFVLGCGQGPFIIAIEKS